RLDHPHIARLLDGGVTATGQPWFAMEQVAGLPLTDFCEQRRLDIQGRLLLFLDVCDAVRYAHQQLVIHRDLKPSNILVTADNRVKLLDFGIARVLEEGGAGQSGSADTATRADVRLLTPEYAAPEQVRGDPATTATDVYALGAVLYEVLSGQRAHRFERHTPVEYERVVCDTEPEPPSLAALQAGAAAVARGTEPRRLSRLLRGDLDTIVLTALRKEPHRRYASVEALVEDLRRFLAGHPIRTRPSSRGYRIRKFMARHRVGVAAAGGIGLALLAGMIGVVWQARVALRERAIAEEVRDYLVGIFEGADPGASSGEPITARELLEQGAARIEAEVTVDPEIRAEMLVTLGTILGKLGVYQRAESLLARGLEARRALHAGDAPALATALQARAELLRDKGELEGAEAAYQEALAMRRRLFGSHHADVARSLSGLASVYRRRGDFTAADSLYRLALAMRRGILGPRHTDVGESLNDLGVVTYQRGAVPAAESLFRQALAIRRELLGPKHLQTMETVGNLAHVLRHEEEFDEAEQLLRQALAVRRELYGRLHPDVALALNDVATVLQDKGQHEAAEPLFREALALRRQVLGERHPHVVTSLNNLALVLHEQGRHAAAESLYRETLASAREVYRAPHPALATTLFGLASTLRAQSKRREVEGLLREGIAIYRDRFREGHPSMAQLLTELGSHLMDVGRPGDAEPPLREAVAYIETRFGTGDPWTAEARLLLERALSLRRQPDRAP
ncbi:MAG: tetratricopeptide repeat protein, partial [Gemmatimonadales bacterium]